jgi:DivIVA domain-containing protein
LITRKEIDSKRFKTTRIKEGYDQEEVDDFLDRVASDFGELDATKRTFEADNLALRGEVSRLRDFGTMTIPTVVAGPPPQAPPATAERILALADETAQKHIGEAISEADGIVAAARARAEGIVTGAEAERQKILNQLESERVELADQIDLLKVKRASYKNYLREALNKMEQEDVDA